MFETSFVVFDICFPQSITSHCRARFSSFLEHYGSLNRARFRLRPFGFIFLSSLILASIAPAQDPATVGQWSSVATWPYISTHAHLLPTGKVLWWPPQTDGDNPHLWDPSTGANSALTKAGANIFCSGH